MSMNDALSTYLRRSGYVRGDLTVEGPHLSHEDAYMSDSGTYWPADTVLDYTTVRIGKNGQRHTKTHSVSVGPSIEFMQTLFDVIEPNPQTRHHAHAACEPGPVTTEPALVTCAACRESINLPPIEPKDPRD